MTKKYTKHPKKEIILPKKETIDFILSYSKALKIVKTKDGMIFKSLTN